MPYIARVFRAACPNPYAVGGSRAMHVNTAGF